MIYLIKSGSYSDVGIHGYFSNAEDAYAYITLYNHGKLKESKDDGWHRERYVEAVEEMHVDMGARPKLLYTFNRCFYQVFSEDCVSTSWKMTYDTAEPEHVALFDDNSSRVEARWRRCDSYYSGTSYIVTVFLTTCDPDKATKIAQDTFYQVIAQKEGLSI